MRFVVNAFVLGYKFGINSNARVSGSTCVLVYFRLRVAAMFAWFSNVSVYENCVNVIRSLSVVVIAVRYEGVFVFCFERM